MTARDDGRHIAILYHAKSTRADLEGSLVYHLASHWRAAGHQVTFLLGTRHYVPADLLFVHVDLSVVPPEYVEFAARYPATVNAGATDIRKSRIAEGLLHPGDAWAGPVIAKSDLNYGGEPEQRFGRWGVLHRSKPGRVMVRFLATRTRWLSPFHGWHSYPIFDRLDLVPRRLLDDHRVVIQPFVPEVEGGLYHVRLYQFLGDRSTCRRISSREPLVKSGTTIKSEVVEPHPVVEQWRQHLRLDYGKIDYVIHEGTPILLDANKTTGVDDQGRGPEQDARRFFHAGGIDSFFR
ncbi:MAG TPA: hypothetical protein VF701_17455 [Thermoanaerobaculia bacterium]